LLENSGRNDGVSNVIGITPSVKIGSSKLTALEKARREDPDRMTAPVSRQMAVSALPASSASSRVVTSSRPFTLLTMPYSSTKDLGKRIKLKVGVSEGWRVRK
jgi:hypothetical protein